MLNEYSRIGLGTWQFSQGKGDLGRFWHTYSAEAIRDIVKAAIDGGVNWFDTAEKYGDGASERALANALKELDVKANQIKIADKWWPKQRKAQSLIESIDQRLDALGGYPIALYQIHWPESLSWLWSEMKCLAKLVESGKVQEVGLCNYNWRQVRRAHKYLSMRGVKLASVQARYSLAYRSIEKNNLLKLAEDLDFKIISWSPLESGLLTGRFHDNLALLDEIKGPRKSMYGLDHAQIERTKDLIDALGDVANVYGVNRSQVALTWMTQRYDGRVLAIPGASSPEQALSNAKAMSIKLTRDEIARVDEISMRVCLLD